MQPLAVTATVSSARLHCHAAIPPRRIATAASLRATFPTTLRANRDAVQRPRALTVQSLGGYDGTQPLTPRLKKHLRGHANTLGGRLCIHQVGRRYSLFAASPYDCRHAYIHHHEAHVTHNMQWVLGSPRVACKGDVVKLKPKWGWVWHRWARRE
jgi:hypothetical protein